MRVEGVSARHDINCQLFPVSVDVHPAFGAAESDCCPWWRKLYRTKGFVLNDTLALRFVALARSPSLSPSWSSMLHWLSNLHSGVMNWGVKATYQLCLQWKSMDTWDTWAFGKMPFGSIWIHVAHLKQSMRNAGVRWICGCSNPGSQWDDSVTVTLSEKHFKSIGCLRDMH